MAWDAFASIDINEDGSLRKYAELFVFAQQAILNSYGTTDSRLKKGGLRCSICRTMLERATGLSCKVEYWDALTVKAAFNKANWYFHTDKHHEWAWASARAFLEVCASCEIGIEFSY